MAYFQKLKLGHREMGRKSKKVHHTVYNISALRWTFKLIQTVFNYKKGVLGCKKALFRHCVFPLNLKVYVCQIIVYKL